MSKNTVDVNFEIDNTKEETEVSSPQHLLYIEETEEYVLNKYKELFGATPQKKISSLMKQYLMTLTYIDMQLAEIEQKTSHIGDFVRNIYEIKNMLIGQRIALLEKIQKMVSEEKEEKEAAKEFKDIVDLLKKSS